MNTMTFEIKSAAHAKLAAEFLARFYALDEPEAVFHHQAAKEVKAEVATEAVIEKAKAKTKPVDKPPVVETPTAPAASLPEAPAITREDAKKAVLGVARGKGHDVAAALLARFSAKKISDVAEEDLAALVEAAKES